MWTPGIVLARYLEAADTERYLAAGGMGGGGGYWPAFIHDEEDRKGWDDAAKADNAEKLRGRAPDGAVSRHSECLDWSIRFIDCEKRRHIVWAWAFCRANGWDFGAKCKKRGWARPTAYRRLTSSFEVIAAALGNDGVLLRLPADKWLRHREQDQAMNSATVGRNVAAEIKQIKPGYRTEVHRDLLTTPEAIADFADFLEKRNAREAKRRARLGMDAA
jgi:hypothetical protein